MKQRVMRRFPIVPTLVVALFVSVLAVAAFVRQLRIDRVQAHADDPAVTAEAVPAAPMATALPTIAPAIFPQSNDRSTPLVPSVLVIPSIPSSDTAGTMEEPSTLVWDETFGRVFQEQGAMLVRPIASITKLMTAIVVVDKEPVWDTMVTIAPEDIQEGSEHRLTPGERVRFHDLMELMLIASDNTAAWVLGHSTGMTTAEFVVRMNERAHSLGLEHTTFVDPTGLGAGNTSTAAEVAGFVSYALKNPTIATITRMKEADIMIDRSEFKQGPATVKRHIVSTNNFIRHHDQSWEIVGGKTGTTQEAGNNLVLVLRLKSSTVTAVVLGTRSNEQRYETMERIIDHASHDLTIASYVTHTSGQ